LIQELNWEPDYCLEKCFRLLTFWLCHHKVPAPNKDAFPVPTRIIKKCVKEGINSYEVEWVPPETIK
jgi:hypothetical protein